MGNGKWKMGNEHAGLLNKHLLLLLEQIKTSVFYLLCDEGRK